ncbi:hypothetical protein VKT23_018597 [Stygiomarasmius scandens]|uniref:Uncharacterized protein n=1 Tax=Marasmiellus scandens TaxID=2682957 RepID=A0ABR1INH7_9AGAR
MEEEYALYTTTNHGQFEPEFLTTLLRHATHAELQAAENLPYLQLISAHQSLSTQYNLARMEINRLEQLLQQQRKDVSNSLGPGASASSFIQTSSKSTFSSNTSDASADSTFSSNTSDASADSTFSSNTSDASADSTFSSNTFDASADSTFSSNTSDASASSFIQTSSKSTFSSNTSDASASSFIQTSSKSTFSSNTSDASADSTFSSNTSDASADSTFSSNTSDASAHSTFSSNTSDASASSFIQTSIFSSDVSASLFNQTDSTFSSNTSNASASSFNQTNSTFSSDTSDASASSFSNGFTSSFVSNSLVPDASASHSSPVLNDVPSSSNVSAPERETRITPKDVYLKEVWAIVNPNTSMTKYAKDWGDLPEDIKAQCKSIAKERQSRKWEFRLYGFPSEESDETRAMFVEMQQKARRHPETNATKITGRSLYYDEVWQKANKGKTITQFSAVWLNDIPEDVKERYNNMAAIKSHEKRKMWKRKSKSHDHRIASE